MPDLGRLTGEHLYTVLREADDLKWRDLSYEDQFKWAAKAVAVSKTGEHRDGYAVWEGGSSLTPEQEAQLKKAQDILKAGRRSERELLDKSRKVQEAKDEAGSSDI